jgi:hypothetical protein
MPTWPIYRLSINANGKEKKAGMISVDGSDEEICQSLNAIYRRVAMGQMELENQKAAEAGLDIVEFHEPLACVALSAELAWVRRGRPTLFIESASLIRTLYECSYNIGFDGICLPGNILSFSFPDNLVVDGVKIPPCLFFRSAIPAENSVDGVPVQRIAVSIREGYGQHQVSTIINQQQLQLILDGNTADIVQCAGEDPLDPDEVKRMSTIFRVLLALSSYLSCFPEALKPGLPGMKMRCQKFIAGQLDKVPPITITQVDKFRNCPDGHFRRSHFRTLYDTRYKRNPDGSYRTVFVSPSFIGGKNLDPSTIEELKSLVPE